MEVKKLLWPTDFSDNAAKALPYVNSLAEKYQTEVNVLYVIPELGLHEPWYGEFDRSHIEKIHAWERETAEKRLTEICDKYLEGCPLYRKHISLGDPAEEILKKIDELQVDLVVMTTKGREGRFAFGNVADRVVKNSPVGVVTIPIKD